MRIVQLHRLAILTVSTAIAWGLIIGCSGETRRDQVPSPEVTVAPEVLQTVSVLVPPDTSTVFGVIAAIVRSSGLPYDIQILEGTSFEAGVRAVIDGKIDLMIVPQRPSPGDPVEFNELVRTPVVILVNSELGIDNLTREQASAIFSGKITNWSQIGASDMGVEVFVQEDDGPATTALENYLPGNVQFAESAQVLFDDRDLITVVNGLPGAIGYSSLATKIMIEEPASDDHIVVVSLEQLSPDDLSYPISIPVGFVYLPERRAYLQALLDWSKNFLDSEPGQLLQQQYGFTAVTATYVEPEDGGNAHVD